VTEEADPVAGFALTALMRRVMSKRPSTTRVTVTRVTGAHRDEEGGPVPETVVVTTAEPVADTAAHRLARTALLVSSVAIALALSTIAWRIVRRGARQR
jgi:hypothetical protein